MTIIGKHVNPDLQANAWYLTQGRAVSGEGAIVGPGGSVAFNEAGTYSCLTLNPAEADGPVGASCGSTGTCVVDDVTSKRWNGNHLAAGITPITLLEDRYVLDGKSAESENASFASRAAWHDWAAFFVLKRRAATIPGTCILAYMGTESGNNRLNLFTIQQDGTVGASGKANGGELMSVASAAGAFPNGETHIFAVASSANGTWRLYKQQSRLATGVAGQGIAPSMWTSVPDPKIVFGGGTGCPDVARALFYGCEMDEETILKMMVRLNVEYNVYG
jgi:hypothetical protein